MKNIQHIHQDGKYGKSGSIVMVYVTLSQDLVPQQILNIEIRLDKPQS